MRVADVMQSKIVTISSQTTLPAAERVMVTWPSGKRQALENVAADRVLTVREE